MNNTKETTKLVCFDLDGVLVDSTDWHYRSFNEAMLEIVQDSISLDEHLRTFNGLPTLSKLGSLVQQGRIPVGQEDRFIAAKAQSFAAIIQDELKPDPVKISMVRQLKRDLLHVAIVSNCNSRNTDLLLGGLGLSEEVDFVVTSSQVVAPKPSPEGYLSVMRHFGVSPDETVIFEDSPVGLAAAKASKAKVIAVSGPHEITYDFVREQLTE